MNRANGFTLIELMIVVAIVAIIASVAYPSYQSLVLKIRRSEAQSTLKEVRIEQENFINNATDSGTYTDEFGPSGLGLAETNTTTLSKKYYDITIEACENRTFADCYIITATATGTQTEDTDCDSMTIDRNGEKTPTDCW